MPAPVNQKPGFGYFGIAKQTLIGTAVAPAYFAPWQSLSWKPVIDSKIVADGGNRDNSIDFKLSQYYQGDVTTYLYPSLGTMLIGAALSGADSVTGSSDPYTHAISTDYHALWPVTVETGYGSVGAGDYFGVLRFTDCYSSDLQISIAGGKEPTLKFGFTGITAVNQATPATVSFESDRPMVPADAAYTWTGLPVNGAPINTTIDIKNQLDIGKRGDSLGVLIVPGNRDVMVTTDIAVTDNLIMRNLLFGADAGTTAVNILKAIASLVVKCDLAGSPDHYVQLTLNALRFTGAEPTYDLNGKMFLIKGAKFTAKTVGGTPAVQMSNLNGVQTAYF